MMRCCLLLCILSGGGSAFAGTSLRITRGGTYSGEFSRIRIATSQPVLIDNSILQAEGNLIESDSPHVNVIIRNVRASGADVMHHAGRFVSLRNFDKVVIANCLLDQTEGIYLLDGGGAGAQTVRIVHNVARNIDGRRSNGRGGYESDAELVQFVQLDKVRHVPGMEIAWNQVINQPGLSRVEDNINIYLSSGTRQSPLKIHDNFIEGAYPADPSRQGYSGGGILAGDGVAPDGPADDASFIEVFDNQVLDTTNYGIAIAAGHDNSIFNNRVVSAGVMPDGGMIAAQNVGIYIWDSYNAGRSHFFNNTGHDNVVGWIRRGKRNDWWVPDAVGWKNNDAWPAPINRRSYEQEWARWQAKLKAAHIHLGPQQSGNRQ